MADWEIPLSDIDLGPEEEQAVLRVVRSRWFTAGAEVAGFEAEFAQACSAPGAVALANCTAALQLACVALGVGPGVEVIVPTLTFVATANAVTLAGGTPVLADSTSEDDFCIDPADVERRITPATRGIICVHYAGAACDMDALLAICERHGLFLIEDAAHAPGGTWNGRALGTIGDIGCFSFFGNKNLTTGEGGMVVSSRPELLERIRLLRSHGMTTTSWDRFKGHAHAYDVVEAGFNYRPTEFAGALGRAQLRKLPAGNAHRRELVERYHRTLSGTPGVDVAAPPEGSACHLAVLVADHRDTRDFVRSKLTEARIQTSLHYLPIHLFAQFRDNYGYQPGSLPVAEDLATRAITLPLYAQMTEQQVDRICHVITSAMSSSEVARARV